MDIARENGRRIVGQRARRRYSLDELLAQCEATDADADSAEDREWMDAKPVGKELL